MKLKMADHWAIINVRNFIWGNVKCLDDKYSNFKFKDNMTNVRNSISSRNWYVGIWNNIQTVMKRTYKSKKYKLSVLKALQS